MENKYQIIGHGLTGCVLALTLYRQQIPFTIIGMTQPGEASIASSGLITPVTGRKYVKSWMIDEFIDTAIDFYSWTEEIFGEKYFYPVDIVRFLSHPEALLAWEKRSEDPEYARYISNKRFEELDRLDRPYGVVTGGYRLHAPEWITAARSFLQQKGLLEEKLDDEIENEAQNLIKIYSTGAIGEIPSAGIIPNKGEALIVSMPGWKHTAIIKEEVFIIPLPKENHYWVGSYYEPWPDDPSPSAAGKQKLMKAIREVYQDSFVVVDHVAGVRATVDDRRPIVGEYSGKRNCFLFNGMGTKGTSLAPYWAAQLVAHLEDNVALPKIVNPKRY